MAYDPDRGVTVLFGGRETAHPENRLNDTWEWDGENWRRRLVDVSPPVRQEHAMFFDEGLGGIILVGGTAGFYNPIADTWLWNGEEWRELDVETPLDSTFAAAAYDQARGEGIMFGWLSGKPSHTWAFTGDAWERRVAGQPFDRATKVYDSLREQAVLFQVDDAITWTWDGVEFTAHDVGPRETNGGAMVFDSGRGVAVLHAWRRLETWEWDGADWRRTVRDGPSVGSMAYDSARGVVVMFGSDIHASDTFEYDGTSWRLVEDYGPQGRISHAMAYDERRGVVVMFGGERNGNLLGDTWEWDGVKWELRSETGPDPREGRDMIYDPVRGQMLLSGGVGGPEDHWWTWDGAEWRPLNLRGPAGLGAFGMVYDTARHAILARGVSDQALPFWIYQTRLRLVGGPEDAQVSTGETLRLSVTAEGEEPSAYQWQRDGEALVDDDRVEGSRSANLVIHNMQHGDAGDYAVLVTSECGSARSREAVVSVRSSVPCEAVRSVRARCRDQVLRARVKLNGESYDGHTLIVASNDEQHIATVRGARATTKFEHGQGRQTITLLDPSCEPHAVAECGGDGCTHQELLFAQCRDEDGQSVVTVTRGVPGQPVDFYLDGAVRRRRTVDDAGQAMADWGRGGGVEPGPHVVSAVLACDDELQAPVDCP